MKQKLVLVIKRKSASRDVCMCVTRHLNEAIIYFCSFSLLVYVQVNSYGHIETLIKTNLISFKSSEHNNEKGVGPYHGCGYLSLSDPIDFETLSQRELL